MIRAFELVDRVKEYNPQTDVQLLLRAYVYGAQKHGGQTRASGEPYFTGHPLAVAAILTEFRLDDATIVTALLHDTVEDTDATEPEIAQLFGPEIARLVAGVTKLTKLELSSAESAQAENFRKLLIAMAKDVRVLLVKLADRLHNMQTIDHLPHEKRARIARETMEIYAPLAGRMGMQNMREQLEDLAFEVLNPEGRTSILRRFLKLRRATGDLVPEITREIQETLDAAGIPAKVEGREKKPYSVWRKMEEKETSFSQLSDIYGFRVLCESDAACYGALGAIHRRWRAVPGRFKDYISGPKANGYRSIHTTVYGARAMRVEIQIRTREMHDVAESGVAAHWAYKDGERAANPFAVDPFKWLRDLVARLEKGDAPSEFLEHVKLDMFSDQVFCFTPKGDVVGLPRGATPIDFAYGIHTRVGDHCAGALVDGNRVPLWSRLRNGQQVEIITAQGQRPSPHWLDMAQTGRAKSAIRRALRDQLREGEVALGRDLVLQAFARAGREAGEKTLAAAASALTFAGVDDLLAAVARGEVGARRAVHAVYPDDVAAPEPAAPPQEPAMRVRGLRRGQAVRFCPSCLPIPGDRVIGLARRSGVEVHAISCPRLEQYEDALERWQDLGWDPEASAQAINLARISLTLANMPGALGHACTLLGERGANIDNLVITQRKPDFFLMSITLEVRDVKHLSGILTALRAQNYVSQAERSAMGEEPASRSADPRAGAMPDAVLMGPVRM